MVVDLDLDIELLQSKENRVFLINKNPRIISFTRCSEKKLLKEKFSYKLQENFNNGDTNKSYNLTITITNPDLKFFLKMDKKEKLEYACNIISKNTDLIFSEKGV